MALASACTHDELAVSDVDDGPGTVTPTNIVSDPTVPGSKRADLAVDDASLASLRSTLMGLLDLQGRAAHAAIYVNPTAATTAQGCAAGTGRLCLRIFRDAGLVFADQINLLPGLNLVPYDSNRVEFIPGQGDGGIRMLPTGFLAQLGIDLTEYGKSGSVDAGDGLNQLALFLTQPDAEVRIIMRPNDVKLASHMGGTGVWMPVDIEMPANTTNHHCIAPHPTNGNKGGGTLPDCLEIMQQMNNKLDNYFTSPSCARVDLRVSIKRVKTWIGLIPRKRSATCDALAFRSDLDWMANVPNGRRYRQGCLDLDFDVAVAVVVNPEYLGGGDITIRAEVSDCSFSAEAYCVVEDCVELASDIAAEEFQKRVNPELRSALRDELRPFFTYSGGSKSPYNTPSAPAGTFCNIADAACRTATEEHHLPASLTRLVYGWFANALGDFSSAPGYQFPVTNVVTNPCPSHPAVGLVSGGPPDLCAACGPVHPDYPHCEGCAFTLASPTYCAPTDPLPLHVCGIVGAMPLEAKLTLEYAPDPDSDGKIGPDDNCPYDANFLQADKDGDEIGDACDDCPCDPDPNADSDGDGVCNQACGGLGDNCPNIPNADQANCNSDAEKARGAEHLGDACDPVPCPNFTPAYTYHALSGPQSPIQLQATALDELSISPIGSFDRAAAAPAETAVTVTETHPRFCIENPQQAMASCFDTQLAVDDSFLTISPSYELEQALDLWHRIAVHDPEVVTLNVVPGVPVGPKTYSSALAPLERRWRWWSDFQRWSTTWGIGWVANLAPMWDPGANQPVANAVLPGVSTDGRLWLHAMTDVGMTSDVGTGLHFLEQPPGMPAGGLANHYEQAQPFSSKVQHTLVDSKVPWIGRYCPTCPEDLGIPTASKCPQCTFEAIPDMAAQFSRMIAIGSDRTPGVVSAGSSLIELRSPLTPALEFSLASDLVWVDQAEPATWFGWAGSAPLAVGISPGADGIREQVFSANGRLYAAADLDRGGPIDQGPALLAASAGSAGRWDYVAVYSRSRARVWLFGGHDGAGAAIHDVWTRSLHGDRWETVPRSGWEPGNVVAATYSHVDRKLWILHEVPGHADGLVLRQLVRLDPETGRGDVLGEWPRLTTFQKFWLRADRTGSLLLYISSSKIKQHAIVELNTTAEGLDLLGVRLAHGELVHPPVIDMSGYWLVTQRPQDKSPRVERLERLNKTSPQWFNMAKWM